MLDRNGNQYDPNQFFHSTPIKAGTANKDVKKPRVTKVKEVLTEKECPCCKEQLDIAEFTFRDKIYKYCTTCRETTAITNDRLIREEFKSNPLMVFVPDNIRLAKCQGCGRVNPVISDFPVNLTTITGFGKYCQPNCKGKKPCPR
ncbi:hypothetical protein [Erwinia phage vB_Ea277G]|nr:hypothetical protein [Erwinia phage vB_Ea277G]